MGHAFRRACEHERDRWRVERDARYGDPTRDPTCESTWARQARRRAHPSAQTNQPPGLSHPAPSPCVRVEPMRRLSLALCLLVTPSVVSAQEVVGRDLDVFTWSTAATRDAWFRMVIPSGDVTVTPASGTQIEVRAEKVRGANRDIGFVVLREGNDVTICAVYDDDDQCTERGVRTSRRWRGSSPRLEVTVRLPAGVRVNARTGNGDVEITNAGADAIASSGNGQVEVRDRKSTRLNS